jgi:hypothetical protein
MSMPKRKNKFCAFSRFRGPLALYLLEAFKASQFGENMRPKEMPEDKGKASIWDMINSTCSASSQKGITCMRTSSKMVHFFL